MIMAYFERVVLISFLVIAIFLGIDLYDDTYHGADLTHVLSEGVALIISLGMLTWYLMNFAKQVFERNNAEAAILKDITADRDRWKERSEQYLRGLGQAIDEQFQLWKLSESEKDIGLLILKGFSHKEIAEIRETSERTVRQQATSVYSKAGIENKAQLSAFFLEDLMLPKK